MSSIIPKIYTRKQILTLLILITSSLTLQAQRYRGSVESGYSFHFGEGEAGSAATIALFTTHGVQLTPHWLVGAGIGWNYIQTHNNYWCIYIPVYADARYTFSNKRFSPFIDYRLGMKLSGRLYTHPSVGIHYMLTKRYGLNFSTSYEIQFRWP